MAALSMQEIDVIGYTKYMNIHAKVERLILCQLALHNKPVILSS